MQTKSGRCHCGGLSYDFSFPDDVKTLPARACSCTFCVKHGGVYTSHPAAVLDIGYRDASEIVRYRFGHGTADFLICRHCGVLVCAISTIDGTEHAVLNINSLDDRDWPAFDRTTTNFDAETPAERLSRRKRNWIGSVAVRAAAA